MVRCLGVVVLGVFVGLAAGVVRADAQTLGTFRWQLSPYCNVVTVTISQQGSVFALDGVDDQCGADRLAAADGTAFFNPDGTIGLGFTIVPAPDGVPLTVEASIEPGSLSGSWRDTAGNQGTLQFGPGPAPGGSPRPSGQAVAGVFLGAGLRLVSSAAHPPRIQIDGAAVADLLRLSGSATNVGLGAGTLATATSDAYSNTALGNQALAALTGGDFNTAVGHEAAANLADGALNVALGARALRDDLSGSRNVALGNDALGRIRVSDANVAVGPAALYQLQLGLDNVGIGGNAGDGLVAGSHNIYLAAPGQNLDNYTTRLGSSRQERAFIGGVRGVQTGASNAVPVVIDANGQLGTVNSSRRFKDDIQDLGAAGEKVLQLRPVQFRYTTPYADGSAPLQYGLIAEEVSEVLPELVARSADGEIETVQYQVLPTLLLKQVQRLERERAAMAERLAGLEVALAAMTPSAGVAPADPRRK
jgi:hypothetical protein